VRLLVQNRKSSIVICGQIHDAIPAERLASVATGLQRARETAVRFPFRHLFALLAFAAVSIPAMGSPTMGFPPLASSLKLPEDAAFLRANVKARRALVMLFPSKPHAPQEGFVLDWDSNFQPRVVGHLSPGGIVSQAALSPDGSHALSIWT
jgi:hypothetical protein